MRALLALIAALALSCQTRARARFVPVVVGADTFYMREPVRPFTLVYGWNLTAQEIGVAIEGAFASSCVELPQPRHRTSTADVCRSFPARYDVNTGSEHFP